MPANPYYLAPESIAALRIRAAALRRVLMRQRAARPVTNRPRDARD